MSDPDPTIPTTEKLARALEALNDPRLVEMITRARAGVYDDFKSELTFPEIALVQDLLPFGHTAFLKRVMEGEFDATPEESAAWYESVKATLPRDVRTMFEPIRPKTDD